MNTPQHYYPDRFRQTRSDQLEEPRCENCFYRVLRKFGETTSNFNVLTRSFETREIARFECRRHAPQSSRSHDRDAWWPFVANDDWCGEWVQR